MHATPKFSVSKDLQYRLDSMRAIPLFKMCKPSHRTPFNDVKNDQASAASVFAFASDF